MLLSSPNRGQQFFSGTFVSLSILLGELPFKVFMHVYIGLSVIVEVYVSLTDTRYLQSLILGYVFLCS